MKFVKMSAAGNDFIVVEGAVPGAEWVRAVCRRGLSVGADGVAALAPGEDGGVRFRFYNPDGTEAFCGNAARCSARYAVERGWGRAGAVRLETAAGAIHGGWDGRDAWIELPCPQDLGSKRLLTPFGEIEGRHVRVGVPHFVVFVEDVGAFPLEQWGPLLRRHSAFGSEGTNVDVVQAQAERRLRIRTWERGVERETLACGSGAVAAAWAAGIAEAREPFHVHPKGGGCLIVELVDRPGAARAVRLTGQAHAVAEGTILPGALEAR